ncbi:hypothetical protein ACQKWADRAFT_298512 [Trichoderma austrokoningii]
MEPNARFDEVFAQLRRRCLNTEEYIKALREILPNTEERHAYSDYCFRQSQPHLANPAGILTAARFIQIADEINFFNPPERKELLPGLTWAFRPWIPLGYEDTTFYRLLPSIHNSTPQKQEYPKTSHEVLDGAFLGVNTMVQPREPSLPLNRRAPNLSEQSTRPAEPEDADAPGFIFHELGELQYKEFDTFAEMPTTMKEGNDCRREWDPTGFSVVARLTDSGHINGVYVVYNMNPRDEFSGKRQQVTHSDWGMLPSSLEMQFSCARIGNALRDFGFKKKLEWDEQIHHPVELVRTVKSSRGVVMRVTVDSNYKR